MAKYKLGGINLSSSVNQEEIATSVKGVILGLSSVIVFVSSLYGVAILPEDVANFATQIGTMVSGIGLAVSSLVTLYGLLRKIIVSYSEEK